jgi:Fic family protein
LFAWARPPLPAGERWTEYADRFIEYFANTVLEAQNNTIRRVDFYVGKAKFYAMHRGTLNQRQEKVVARMFRKGIDGFKGGLSAENYISSPERPVQRRQEICRTLSRRVH